MTTYLAIDFGGTRSRAALFDEQLNLLRRAETPSRVDEGVEPVLNRLIALGESLLDERMQPTAIGIAAPGPLDTDKGIIIKSRVLPGWSMVEIGPRVSGAFDGAPTVVQNDANLGALAEYQLGAGKGCDPMIYLTISTGIGGGVIIGGELFTGWRGLAAEPGHMRLMAADGTPRRLEELASGTAIGESARRRLRETDTPSSLRSLPVVDGRAVGEAALQGDALALNIVRQAGEWLGFGLVNLLHLFNRKRLSSAAASVNSAIPCWIRRGRSSAGMSCTRTSVAAGCCGPRASAKTCAWSGQPCMRNCKFMRIRHNQTACVKRRTQATQFSTISTL